MSIHKLILCVLSIFLYALSPAVQGARCGNSIVVNYAGPGVSEINVTGVPIGATIARTNLSITATCTQAGLAGEMYLKTLVNPSTSCSSNFLTDTSGVVKLRACIYSDQIVWGYAPNTAIGSSNTIRPIDDSIVLVKKVPGRTLVDLSTLHRNFTTIYSAARNYSESTQLENAARVSGNFTPFYVVYTPQCVVSVSNNINFGDVAGGAIINGTVAEQYADLQINCDDILSKYSLNIAPVHGVANVAQGIINSAENSTIGFRIRWGDAQVGTSGAAVSFNQELTGRNPAKNKTIRFLVKPVSLVAGRVKGGLATSSLNINVTFE